MDGIEEPLWPGSIITREGIKRMVEADLDRCDQIMAEHRKLAFKVLEPRIEIWAPNRICRINNERD